jgi:hypothetical protein
MTVKPDHPKANFWRDERGKVVIWQAPNFPLIGWAVTMVASWVLAAGFWKQAFSYVSFGLLFTWAWLELATGKSYFRRALGLVILLLIIYDRARV